MEVRLNPLRLFSRLLYALLSVGLLLGAGNALAQKAADAEVLAANQAFYAALSARDVVAMQKLWSGDADIGHISPFDKAASIGWDAVKKDFEGTFGAFTELKVTMEQPSVKIHGSTAWVNGIEKAQWKNKAGEVGGGEILGTTIFVKQAGHWLVAFHHASMMPK